MPIYLEAGTTEVQGDGGHRICVITSVISPAYQTLTGSSISIPEPLPANTLLPDSCAAVLNSTHQTKGRGSGQTWFYYVAPVYIRERHSGGQFCHTKGNCKLEE